MPYNIHAPVKGNAERGKENDESKTKGEALAMAEQCGYDEV